ncbi:MAG: endonuclease/exonuclease/phosphatase family protein [Gammaproteobacteria bacterium]
MNEIQLQYVENVITRKKRGVQQHLTFFIAVENLSYHKQIDVLWTGEDGIWHTLPARFHSKLPPNRECWQAHIQFQLSAAYSLPGNITFSLRYRAEEVEYWDNNKGGNYTSQADSGIDVPSRQPVQVVGFNNNLPESRKYTPVTVAVDKSLAAEKVTVHWTTDNWRHTHETACHFKRTYWDKELQSNARNPNQYGTQVWKGWLKTGDAFRLHYSVSAESRGRLFWDNNHGNNYQASHTPLKILILNLHCYQEDHQDRKFSQIAKAIGEHGIDIVCFQEVAEFWNDGKGDWPTNSANIINGRLKKPYHLYTDWSHLGFEKYREGVAILSRFPLLHQESRYVSDSDDPYNIHSRKVVMAQIDVPHIGLLNIFSAHLSWWEDGFESQFDRLREWAASKAGKKVKGSLLCGDFNIAAGSKGYRHVIDTKEYDDQFLAANAQGAFEKIFRVNDPYWRNYLADDYRIDYIFMNKDSDLCVTSGHVLFTPEDHYGPVSDHCGYLMTFEPK